MQTDWHFELKLLMASINEHALEFGGDGKKTRFVLFHRGQRLVVEARIIRGRVYTDINLYCSKGADGFTHKQGFPVFRKGVSVAFNDIPIRKQYQTMERWVYRFYSKANAQLILDRCNNLFFQQQVRQYEN